MINSSWIFFLSNKSRLHFNCDLNYKIFMNNLMIASSHCIKRRIKKDLIIISYYTQQINLLSRFFCDRNDKLCIIRRKVLRKLSFMYYLTNIVRISEIEMRIFFKFHFLSMHNYRAILNTNIFQFLTIYCSNILNAGNTFWKHLFRINTF